MNEILLTNCCYWAFNFVFRPLLLSNTVCRVSQLFRSVFCSIFDRSDVSDVFMFFFTKCWMLTPKRASLNFLENKSWPPVYVFWPFFPPFLIFSYFDLLDVQYCSLKTQQESCNILTIFNYSWTRSSINQPS